MSWDSLDNDQTFRLVFTDYQDVQNYNFMNIMKDMIGWRNAQSLPMPKLYVIKIGYSNFLEHYSLDIISDFFIKHHSLFQGIPIRFSIYQSIHKQINEEQLNNYNMLAQKLQQYNIHCTIAWVIDFNTINDINHVYDFTSQLKDYAQDYIYINNVAVFYNTGILKEPSYKILKDTVKTLEQSGVISGYDITSHLNNFNIYTKSNIIESNLLNLVTTLIDYNSNFAEKIAPEIKALLNKNFSYHQSFGEQVAEFCQNGYIINIKDNTISPLIYGSTDDFSFNSNLNIYEFLLMIYSEVNIYFEKHLTKIFLKSYCSGCEHLNFCQQQKIYWLNLPYNKQCYIKVDKFIEQN